jgi:hypothetical protein
MRCGTRSCNLPDVEDHPSGQYGMENSVCTARKDLVRCTEAFDQCANSLADADTYSAEIRLSIRGFPERITGCSYFNQFG